MLLVATSRLYKLSEVTRHLVKKVHILQLLLLVLVRINRSISSLLISKPEVGIISINLQREYSHNIRSLEGWIDLVVYQERSGRWKYTRNLLPLGFFRGCRRKTVTGENLLL